MHSRKFDVIVIGSGPAGVTAAGALAGTGVSVAVIESAVYTGAENWSGCVYFTESLAAPDCYGPEAVAAAPFERRVAKRGTLMHNALDVIGLDWHDSSTFKNCYTVLRPVYDPYFAHLARMKGAVLLSATTVTSLIRKNSRVIGVETSRGPLFADVTFIAEGDASHLVRAENLERTAQPHFLQGVKAVLSLPAAEIEKRFGLDPDEGAAYEILVRDPAIAGRTAHLNIGAFLYTNRDSISIGYVAPLDRVRDNYRGSHDRVYEWICGLPWFRDRIRGARMSAYGTKIIRSGGWRERPILVMDGLVVGGSSAGLGIDIPFPNFTGPASATGLCFGRAVKNILKQGHSFDAQRLRQEYESPLRESLAGRNAQYLSRWPSYFGASKVLFSRTIDVACAKVHFLAEGRPVQAAKFLRPHLLSFRALRELLSDTLRAMQSLSLVKPVLSSLFSPATLGRWVLNLFRKAPPFDQRLGIVIEVNDKSIDAQNFPWPLRPVIERLSPALARAVQSVYANDDRPLQTKFSLAVSEILQAMSLLDILLLPVYACVLVLLALATAAIDAFRFSVLKTPVQAFLAEPARAYAEAQKKARDLDSVKPATSLEAKLATNTYRTGSESHIRTLWPAQFTEQPTMAQTGLWWVCPARVYVYDPPQFIGRGKVTVNYENCIKCESCWRSEPGAVLWGRQTDHRLIYRPESSAYSLLLQTLKRLPAPVVKTNSPEQAEPLPQGTGVFAAAQAVLNAAAAFNASIRNLPASADKARTAWTLLLGKRLEERLSWLASALESEGRRQEAGVVREERASFASRLEQTRLFHALYAASRITRRIQPWFEQAFAAPVRARAHSSSVGISHADLTLRFPDREVKAWEDSVMSEAWCETVRNVIGERSAAGADLVRSLSRISPALGLIASRQLTAMRILDEAGMNAERGTCALDGSTLSIDREDGGIYIRGSVDLVPAAASRAFLVLAQGMAYLLPHSTPGITITPTPAIGFRAAGLARIEFACTVTAQPLALPAHIGSFERFCYFAIALGASDYLSARVKEHATGRIQFGGQMLDTEGRDGIAKLGAVKALVSRVESWHILLERLCEQFPDPAPHAPSVQFDHLFPALAAKAFGPQPGSLGYDAGQIFGGFAYSEDDLLSRFYRDSSLFPFLAPGYRASAMLNREIAGEDLLAALPLLGRLEGISGPPFAPLVQAVTRLADECGRIPSTADPARAGEARALVVGIRSLLASLEQDLDEGRGSEAEACSVSVLVGMAHDAILEAKLSAGRGAVSPSAVFPIEPGAAPVAFNTDYDAFCSAGGGPHESGSFLKTLSGSPQFVPEMQLDDEKLFQRWTDLVAWFKTNCSEKSFDGLPIERFIEKHHRLPQDIIEAVKKNQWLATTIPRSLDGLGWRKAEYYILNSAAGSFGDASIDLLIMASTSIGTTPILLGLEEEMPRVREELSPLVQDERKLGEISSRLDRLIRSLANPDPAWIRKEFEELLKLVDQRIGHTRVVKYLAANFLKAFYGAGLAGRRGDFSGFRDGLTKAGTLFGRIMPDVRAALDELPRRERCHRLFLRALGHGAISAFALTEPTAGSDSGGVRTTAVLARTRLQATGDGRYAFRSDDDKRVRYLIDADRIEFTDQGMAFRTPDNGLQQIRYDRYDYATDQGVRLYIYEGTERPFHDIAQVRSDGSGLFYEYYSLIGAKMWITNGSIASQFCLYAQTPEGVTGFLVDRHAEGLKVGADEKKTGQRGSPTNEISIDSVRVPREAVIGYEGHGQVNALETLNVGRCGLAVVSGALMRKLMHEANAALPASAEKDRLLGEAAAILFGSESLAWHLVGLFDRPHQSVRMESAIAKYACSEDIHELLALLEQAYGPAAQTEQELIEKARRDSRILTIYEGTNEVQRFLILKDLIAHADNWPELPGAVDDTSTRSLAAWKNSLRKHAKEAAALLGDTSWSDAMLQPALFPLSDMAGEILRLECIQGRMQWLEREADRFGKGRPGYAAHMLAAGARAAERTAARLAHLETRFLQAWEMVKDNLDLPEVRTCDAALDALARKEEPAMQVPQVLTAPLRVLSIIRPVADLAPHPSIENGALQELVWKMNPLDLAALTRIGDLKTNSPAQVIVDVLMPGGAEQELLLREVAGSFVGRLFRLDADPSTGPEAYAQAIADLEAGKHYDLIATGATSLDGDQSLGPYLAGRLRKNLYQGEAIQVKHDGSGIVDTTLPSIVSLTSGAGQPETGIEDLIAAQEQAVKIVTPGEGQADAGWFGLSSGTITATPLCRDPLAAAEYIRAYAASAGAGAIPDYEEALSGLGLPDGALVAAILEPQDQKGNLAVLRACRVAADLLSREAVAFIPAPRQLWRGMLGLARACGCDSGFCIDTRSGRLSRDGRGELLRQINERRGNAISVAGKEWITALALTAGEAEAQKQKTLLCSGITKIARDASGSIVLKQPAYDNKLDRSHTLAPGIPAFVSIADDADFPSLPARREFEAHALDFTVRADWILQFAPVAPPSLASADVVIDIGYGIRDGSGMNLAQELKRKLEQLGLSPLFGATRKVTQDLKLLPLDAQIGQTGIRVNPKLIIALGISGAPQHIDYVGTRAEILCFNKDSEAPLMNLNRNRPSPRVHPVLGDLFVTVRQLIERL